MPELVIEFEGTLRVTEEELRQAEGDAAQAVQNQIGHTGAVVDHAAINDFKGPKRTVGTDKESPRQRSNAPGHDTRRNP